jgi:hypothetical protein
MLCQRELLLVFALRRDSSLGFWGKLLLCNWGAEPRRYIGKWATRIRSEEVRD